MGKETWARELGQSQSPGPANYTTSGRIGKSSPAYTIKHKYSEKDPPYAPPYVNLATTVGQSPRYTIRPKTGVDVTSSTPGPSYLPPPFAHNLLSRGKMRSCSVDRESQNPSLTNDQNLYDTRHRPNDKRPPAFKIGEGVRSSWLRGDENPSGASYRPNGNLMKPSIPKYSIGNIHSLDNENKNPGPGEYNNIETFGKRSLAIRPKTGEFKPDPTPGPGEYEIKPLIGMGSPRTTIRPLYAPKQAIHGVPYRKLNREFDQVKGMTISPKTKLAQSFSTPGPADYSLRSSWNSSRGYKMSPRDSKEQIHGKWLDGWRSPGPAEYDSDDKTIRANAPAYSLRDSCGPSAFPTSTTPGPSEYSQDRTPIEPRSPRFTIRPKCQNKDTESPTKDAGYVALYGNIPHAGPAVSIRPREELSLIPQ